MKKLLLPLFLAILSVTQGLFGQTYVNYSPQYKDNYSGVNNWLTAVSLNGSPALNFTGGTSDASGATPTTGQFSTVGTPTAPGATYSTTITQGQTYTLTLTKGANATYDAYCFAYIDFNADGDFIDAGEQIMGTGSSSTTQGVRISGAGTQATSTFTAPFSTPGSYRMRCLTVCGNTTCGGNYTGPSGSFSNLWGGAKDFTVVLAAATPCSGTPASLTVSPASASLCSSSTTVLSFSPTTSGLTYQWQESNAVGGPYVNVTAGSGATTPSFTTPTGSALPFSTTYYRCNVTCTASGQTTATTIATVTRSSFLSCYCTPTWSQNNGGTRGITQVILNGSPNISNTSTINNTSPYYTLYTAASPVANAGLAVSTAYSLQVKVGTQTASNHYAAAWIDYNQNGIFETTEYLGIFGPVAPNTTGTINFTVPGGATPGTTMMRVIGRFGTSGTIANSQACASFTGTLAAGGAGETEDYYVNITASACTGTPTPGSVTPTTSTLCPNGTTTISLSGQTTGVSGITYQWQSAPTAGGTYSNVVGGSGATTATYTTPALANGTGSAVQYFYKCLVTCTNSSSSDIQVSPATITVNPTPNISVSPSSATICNGSNTSLTASNASVGTTTYAWSPSTGLSGTTGATVTASPTTSTTYTVIGTAGGCSNTGTTVAVTVNPSTITVTPASPTITIGGSTTLTASATSTNGTVTYTWSPSTGLSSTTGASVTANPLTTTTYTVTASDGTCSRSTTVTVNVNSGTTGTVACGYTYSTTTGFSSISGTSLGSNGSNNYTVDLSGLSPAFNFDFNGLTYNKFGVNGNGFIYLGTGAPTATLTAPLSNSITNVDGIIAPFAGTPQTAGTVSYLVQGTSPNRTLTVYWNGGSSGNAVRFTAVLYETTHSTTPNRITFSYSDMSAQFTSMSINAQVGIRGASTSDYLNRTKAASSGGFNMASYPSAGSSSSATVSCNSADYINANSTLIYSPNIATPTISPSTTQNICLGGSGVTLTATTTVSSPTYQWLLSGSPISGANSSTYLANPTPAGNYFYAVKVTNGSGCSRTSYVTPVVAAQCTPLAFAVTGSNSCTSSTIGVANSETGVNYQLVLNGVTNVGSPVAGTGSAISFGAQTTAGVYTVVGTNLSGSTDMTGSVTVYGNPATPTGLVDQERCLNGNVTFTANDPGAGYEIQWSTDGVNNNGGAGLTYTVAVATGSPVTMYARTRYITGNCLSAWVPVTGTAYPSPNPNASALDVDVCYNDAINLTADIMATYSWTGPNGFTSIQQNPTINNAPLAAGGTYTVNVTDSHGCAGSGSVSINVATCGTVIWTGNVDHNWNIAGNWSGGFVPSVLNDVQIPDVANDPILTTGADGAVRNITIGVGATITVNSGKKISIKGNWVGNQVIVSGAGQIEFNGSAAQSITGGAQFTNLAINNSHASGVTITTGGLNQVKVSTGVNLVKGPLTTNGNLYLTSTPTETAYINNFGTLYTGTITGTISMERHNPGATGFRYLSMPINNPSINQIDEVGLIGADMAQLIPTSTCSPSSLAQNSPYGNVMEWHEDGPFNPVGCRQGGWYVRSAGTLENFRGYLAKMYQGQTVVVTGTPNLTSQTYAQQLNNTNPTGDGWHLMGNPYPSPVQWTGVTGFGDMNLFSTSGIYTGTYASYAPVQNKIIATMQGFFVRRLGPSPATFSLPNASRRAVSTISYQSTADWYNHLLEIDITGNGFADHSTLYFNSGATAGYEAYYDARKMDGRLDQPVIYTHLPNGNEQLGVNGLGNLDQTYAVPLVMKPGQNGEFTLNFTELATFPASAMVYLQDLQTGTLTDLRQQGSYTFASDINDNPERFIIRFEPPVVADITDATCQTNGAITVTQQGNTVWSSYELRDNANNLYAAGNNLNGMATFTNLPAQEYILTLTHPSGYVAEEYFTVNGVSNVLADMNVSDNDVAVNEPVTFTANVTNANELVWNFGDGEQAIGAVVNHSYATAGNYAVILTASNQTCDDVASSIVKVSTATGITNTTAESLAINGFGNQLTIEFNNWGAQKADIFVFNALGQRVESFTGVSTLKGRQLITIADVKPGYYFIQVVSNGKVNAQKVYLGSN